VVSSNAPAGCSPIKTGKNLEIGEARVSSPRGTVFVVMPGEKSPPPHNVTADTYATLKVNDPAVVSSADNKAGWQEEWPLKACGQDRSVLVWFIPYKTPPGQMFTAISPHWPGTYTRPKQ
jgi:hypothetical protein